MLLSFCFVLCSCSKYVEFTCITCFLFLVSTSELCNHSRWLRASDCHHSWKHCHIYKLQCSMIHLTWFGSNHLRNFLEAALKVIRCLFISVWFDHLFDMSLWERFYECVCCFMCVFVHVDYSFRHYVFQVIFFGFRSTCCSKPQRKYFQPFSWESLYIDAHIRQTFQRTRNTWIRRCWNCIWYTVLQFVCTMT